MTDIITKTVINAIAIITMLAVLSGMLFCFPFLWSSKINDLVAAGFPFVGGSILFGTGLITLGIFNRQQNK